MSQTQAILDEYGVSAVSAEARNNGGIAVNTGKICTNCGKPAPAADWTCECGAVNTGKFCSNCGKQRP